jgi:hypothetical protein
MPFATDMAAAARRHLQAADMLFEEGKRKDVAGYLFGIAAECAVKALMLEAGLRPDGDRKSIDDPFWAHFPELRTLLRDKLGGRRSATLTRLVQDDGFLMNWATRMRYSHGRDIDDRWILKWATQAKDVVGLIGTS